MKEDIWTLYGNVRILKSWCEECRRWAFVIDQERACCGAHYAPRIEPRKQKRVSEPEFKRKQVSARTQKAILGAQDWRCYWCERRFGDHVDYGGKDRVLKIHFDHKIPFAYSANNSPENMVASCNICNSWKSSMIFKAEEEIRVYVNAKWQEKAA